MSCIQFDLTFLKNSFDDEYLLSLHGVYDVLKLVSSLVAIIAYSTVHAPVFGGVKLMVFCLSCTMAITLTLMIIYAFQINRHLNFLPWNRTQFYWNLSISGFFILAWICTVVETAKFDGSKNGHAKASLIIGLIISMVTIFSHICHVHMIKFNIEHPETIQT